MNPEKQSRIEQRAYALWQAEGRPAGKHEDHWHRAARDVEAEEREPRSQPISLRAKVKSQTPAPPKRKKSKA